MSLSSMHIKTDEEIGLMAEDGKILCMIKAEVKKMIKPGVSAAEVENLTVELIKKYKVKSSFKMVPGYRWATCVNTNEGVVHGIPHKSIVFGPDDIVSVDMGVFHKGFHTDTSFSVYLGSDKKKKAFMKAGEEALSASIAEFKEGNFVADISSAMQTVLEKHKLTPIRNLTGHGVGRELHEDPRVPCYVSGSKDERVRLVPGLVLAIEVMYAKGSDELVLEDDEWTISTKDGKISALYEETVSLTKNGIRVLTA